MLEPTDDARDWQAAVVKELRELSEANTKTAIVLERLSGQVTDLNEWRKEQRQAARELPATQAAVSATVAQWLIAAIAVIALILSTIGHISLH